jgi:hypothetical protein
VKRSLLAGSVATGLLFLPSACGGGQESESGDPDAGGFSAAADTNTCADDATQVTSTPDGFPADFPLPGGTVVFNIEDRGKDGVIATAVTTTAFDDVLNAMNAAKKAGYRVTGGETEEDDAEANWTGHGFVGRWSIKKSASCPGETVIQLLAARS